jgi:hypothetical protein
LLLFVGLCAGELVFSRLAGAIQIRRGEAAGKTGGLATLSVHDGVLPMVDKDPQEYRMTNPTFRRRRSWRKPHVEESAGFR